MNTRAITATKYSNEDHFPDLVKAMHEAAKYSGGPFFLVETQVPLYVLWLEGFETDRERQHHTCHCCRRFLETYGALAVVDSDGKTRSVFWDEDTAPDVYAPSVARLREAVDGAPIKERYLSSERVWGTPETPDKKRGMTWSHFSYASTELFSHPLKTPFQAAAEVREERGMLERALEEFSHNTIATAKALLETEQLYRSEKVLGVATWLLNLQAAVLKVKNVRLRDNLLWKETVLAPPGFCHVRSSMIGTLLEDLTSGAPFEDVKRRFAEKMHPLQYQRAQVLPSDGNVAQAEKIIEKLRTARALDRRFAKLEDLELLWCPEAPKTPSKPDGGVFGHLKTKAPEIESIGSFVTMTWDKFSRTVLPTVERIDFSVPAHGNFIALVTAADLDAPPMLQWDREDQRNPVSWYVYNGGSSAATFNLQAGWCRVSGIALMPPMWHDGGQEHQGCGVNLILEGARDTKHTVSGGFFTETLKSEYHGVRRTLEAYMMRAKIEGRDEATACGYNLSKGDSGSWNARVRVTSKGVTTLYNLDRWD